MLRCTKCGQVFDLQMEFSKCPECKVGFLVGGYFAKTDKSAIYEDAGSNLDDFFDSGYVDEIPEHPMCSCHFEPVENYDKEELIFTDLILEDVEIHDFMCHTLIPLIDKLTGRYTIQYSSTMEERFIRTFEKDAVVPVGHRNS